MMTDINFPTETTPVLVVTDARMDSLGRNNFKICRNKKELIENIVI